MKRSDLPDEPELDRNGVELPSLEDVDDVQPRRVVLAFSRIMERKLQDNDHKGGWHHEGFLWLLSRAIDEMVEVMWSLKIVKEKGRADAAETFTLVKHHLKIAAELLDDEHSPVKVTPETLFELADVANFSMMAADVAGFLKKRREKK